MSYADYLFILNCRNILSEGISDEGFNVRPHWEDGTPAYTKKLLHLCDTYRLTRDSIPVMTIRKTGFEKSIDEILWIYQKASNRIADLNSHIWDEWNVGDDTIGKAYGYQMSLLHRHHKYVPGEQDFWDGYRTIQVKDDWVYMNQIDAVIWDLKYNPASRSIITNLYNHEDLHAMGLRPCAYSMTYNVTKGSDGSKILNSMLVQRSQDMLTANNWNTVQYAVLTHMLAQVCGMQVGQFTHIIADAHIYDRHIPIVKDMIFRYESRMVKAIFTDPSIPTDMTLEDCRNIIPHPNPKFWINPEIDNFYQFTVDDFKLLDYEYEPFNHRIPIAI